MKLQQQNGKCNNRDLHLEPAATIHLIETANPKVQLRSADVQDKGVQLQEKYIISMYLYIHIY